MHIFGDGNHGILYLMSSQKGPSGMLVLLLYPPPFNSYSEIHAGMFLIQRCEKCGWV